MWWEEQRSVLPFRDRSEAGRLLADALSTYAGRADVLVLALPRGGIPVAWQIAKALGAPLDVFVVRKLGAPGNPELAMGAVAPGGVCILQEQIIADLRVPAAEVARIAADEQERVRQNEGLYRRNLPAHAIAASTAIVVDDGIATGSTMRAAIAALRQLQAARIIVAVPVAPPSTCRDLEGLADQVVCLATPEMFFTVGQWYVDFEQVQDEEIIAILERASSLV